MKKKFQWIMIKKRKFLPPKQTKELKNFQAELEMLTKIAALFPCKREKLYEEFQAKWAHLLKDENLPDIWKQFDEDYEKRY